ncbi:MAG: enoyl-CoA hydratase/isomerase family protein [Candidatus Latescibacterota bacterium]
MASTNYQSIKVMEEGSAATITLARPQVRNAFDETLIGELTAALRDLSGREKVRVIVLTGEGGVFSAGADLNWMRRVAEYGYKDNVADALKLADLMKVLYETPKATIARINGPCIGGALGLISACDIAVSSSEAFFALREIRLGITPAVISPYVIRRIGERHARDYFLTGRRMNAATAQQIGLVNEIVEPDQMDDAVKRWIKRFMLSGPEAVKACKELIARVSNAQISDVKQYTAEMIAGLRGSEEGKEGFAAFFEKRKTKWDMED